MTFPQLTLLSQLQVQTIIYQINQMSKPIRRPIAGPRRPIVGTSAGARKPVAGSRAGTNARPADEGYLYVAGVRDASQRVSEFRVCLPSLDT